jgi:ribosomal protein S20
VAHLPTVDGVTYPRFQIGTLTKKIHANLPLYPTQFATLEIEKQNKNVTQVVAFFIFHKNRASHLVGL